MSEREHRPIIPQTPVDAQREILDDYIRDYQASTQFLKVVTETDANQAMCQWHRERIEYLSQFLFPQEGENNIG